MDHEHAFVEAIREEPDDESLKLIFADWLEDQGDPRGKWIRDSRIQPWMAPTFENPIPRLIEELSGQNCRKEVQHALVAIGEPAVEPLAELLTHARAEVRICAAKCLRRIGSEASGAIPALLRALEESSGNTRLESIKALAKIGVPKGTDLAPLRAALTALETGVGEVASKILAKLETKQAVVEELRERLDDPEEDIRREAVITLSTINTKESIEVLGQALEDESPFVRETAAAFLGFSMNPLREEAVEPLGRALRKPQTEDCFGYLLGALGRFGEAANPAVSAVVELVRTTELESVRAVALETLGVIGKRTDEVREVLVGALTSDYGIVVKGAMTALATWETLPASLEAGLLEAWGKCDTEHEAEDALAALGRFESPSDAVFETLLAVLESSRPMLVDGAVATLGKYGEAAAEHIPRIIAAAGRWSNHGDVGKALARMGVAGREELGKCLRSNSDTLWLVAVRGIESLGPEAGEFLPEVRRRLATTKSDWLPAALIRCLARMGDIATEAIPEIIPHLVNENFGAFEEASEILMTFGAELVPHGDAIGSLLADERKNGWAFARICEVLGVLAKHTPTAFEPIHAVLRYATRPDRRGPYASTNYISRMRLAAVEGLGVLGEAAAEAVPDLLPLLEDESAELRREVVRTLGRCRVGFSVDRVRRLIRDADAGVRQATAETLGLLGSKKRAVVESLLWALDDEVAKVRRAAVSSLGELGADTPDVRERLVMASEDDADRQVRARAKRVSKQFDSGG